jgi:hypothetical protein
MYKMVSKCSPTNVTNVAVIAQNLYLGEIEYHLSSNCNNISAEEVRKVRQLMLYLRDVYLGDKAWLDEVQI